MVHLCATLKLGGDKPEKPYVKNGGNYPPTQLFSRTDTYISRLEQEERTGDKASGSLIDCGKNDRGGGGNLKGVSRASRYYSHESR